MSYADVNGLSLYYEEHGAGAPLVLLHGGIGASEMFAAILDELAEHRRVIAVDLQGHGHTADIDRPLRAELLADDIAALIGHLGLERAEVMGYSLGGMVALRTAIQHPARVRRLVLVSIPFRRDGSFPEVLAAMDAMGPEIAEMIKQAPVYEHYARVAPRPDDWTAHIAKTAEFVKADFDWSADVSALTAPTMLVYADADSVRLDHIVEFYGLLGGGRRDAGVDGSGRPRGRLAVLPGTTHYDIVASPLLAAAVVPFLEAPEPE
ncbi:MAG TPA: alpha/beta fold hydrolase [Solirubrobacteraceae bacterium]|nr:alpha/beta fold hydrolase [Solirubrobacteraceae bacterium]